MARDCTDLCAMHQSSSSQVPINIADARANCIQRKPKHQILWAIASVNRDNFFRLYAQIIHKPIAHPDDGIEELFVRPRFAFEDQEGVVWLVAQGLVFPDMVNQDPLLNHSIGHIVEHILCGRKATASMSQVVYDMMFRVQVGSQGCCASRSCSDH